MTQQVQHPISPRDPRTGHLVQALTASGLVDPTRGPEAVVVVDRVLAGQAGVAAPVQRRLAELAGYVGGSFVLAAAGILLAVEWGDLATSTRVGLLAAVAVLLAAVGVVVRGFRAAVGAHEPARRRLAGVLLTGAAISAAGSTAVLLDDVVTSSDTAPALAASAVLAVLCLLGHRLSPTVVGQLGAATGAACAAPLALELLGAGSELATGLAVLAVGVAWLLAAERGLWREVACARVTGCGLALLGAQVVVFVPDDQRWIGYLTLAVVAASSFAVYVARPAWPYLALGVTAVTLVVPEAMLDWTDNALGPAGGMLVAGATLLAASLVGFRLRRSAGTEVVG